MRSTSGELRADAQRNVEAILDAATRCLRADPDVSVGAIAKAAGVGRVTLYGHFPTRADLVAAVLERVVARTSSLIDEIDLEGDPAEALGQLVDHAWDVLGGFVALHAAGVRALPSGRLHEAHERPRRVVEQLIARGREERVFRSDQPVAWLVTVFFSVMHTAADEVHHGRLASADASALVRGTLLAAYAPPRPSSRAGRR